MKALAGDAEGDDVFAKQTVHKMQVHKELASQFEDDALKTKSAPITEQLAKLLKPVVK